VGLDVVLHDKAFYSYLKVPAASFAPAFQLPWFALQAAAYRLTAILQKFPFCLIAKTRQESSINCSSTATEICKLGTIL
jgi:hypothetical protein